MELESVTFEITKEHCVMFEAGEQYSYFRDAATGKFYNFKPGTTIEVDVLDLIEVELESCDDVEEIS